MLGAHDLEEFYEQQDEHHERRHETRAAGEDGQNCPLCAVTKTPRRLPFLPFGRMRRFG